MKNQESDNGNSLPREDNETQEIDNKYQDPYPLVEREVQGSGCLEWEWVPLRNSV